MKNTHTINTTMREAFIAAFKRPLKLSNTVEKVLGALDTKAGVVKRPDWNAHLSFKTAQQLTKQGILVA